MRVLFVCLGNICRSPMAEGVFRHELARRRLARLAEADSAGTGGWHVGEAPDARAQAALRARGIDISGLRARRVGRGDFAAFDLMLAMDRDNLAELERMAPAGHGARLKLFLDFAEGAPVREVPDPYFGGADGFARVLDLVEAGARGLAAHLAAKS